MTACIMSQNDGAGLRQDFENRKGKRRVAERGEAEKGTPCAPSSPRGAFPLTPGQFPSVRMRLDGQLSPGTSAPLQNFLGFFVNFLHLLLS
jgi:hypothetical protein